MVKNMTMKTGTQVSIVIPTYNEKSNIGVLLDKIDRCLENVNYEIVVVDDNSTDGTIEIVNNLISKYPVKLMVRTGIKGLASAVVEGFVHTKGDVPYIIVSYGRFAISDVLNHQPLIYT